MTLYAKTTIKPMLGCLEYSLIDGNIKKTGDIPKYLATIEVYFEGEIPEKIMRIMGTGVFE